MFARFDENQGMTLRVIKETKRYGRTHGRTDARTDGQRENSIPPTNKVCGGYKYWVISLKVTGTFMLNSINSKSAALSLGQVMHDKSSCY